MSDDLVFDAPETGVQNDGEPVVVPAEPEPVAAEPEESPETEGEESGEELEAAEAPKKKSGSQRWKEKAQREAEEKEYWKRQALAQKEPEKPAAPVAAEGKPQLDAYDTHAEWVEAVAEWKVDQKLKAREEQGEATKRQQSWEQKAKEAREEIGDDFDDALESAPAPSRAVAEVLSESPLGAKLAYHLASHPEEYSRINRLSPIAAARELGLIEARIAAPIEKKPRTTDGKATLGPANDALVVTREDCNEVVEMFGKEKEVIAHHLKERIVSEPANQWDTSSVMVLMDLYLAYSALEKLFDPILFDEPVKEKITIPRNIRSILLSFDSNVQTYKNELRHNHYILIESVCVC